MDYPKTPKVNSIKHTLGDQHVHSISDLSVSSRNIELNEVSNLKYLKKNKIAESFETMLSSKVILSNNSNMLICKPYIIFEILGHIKTCSSGEKLEIAEKLNWLINRMHVNSYIITNKSILKEFKTEQILSFIDELVDILIESNRETKFIDAMLDIVALIVKLSGVGEYNFYSLLKKINKIISIPQKYYDSGKFDLMLKIINKFLTKSIHDGKNFPERFFFFNNYMSELKVNSDDIQTKNISLVKGYTFAMWIYLEKVTYEPSNKKITDESTLFYIHTSKYIAIEALLKKNKIYYKISFMNDIENNSTPEGELIRSEEVYLADIEYNRWTFLVFTHKPVSFLQKPSINLYVNGENPVTKLYEFPNLNNQKVISIGILKNFTGLLSNVFMSNESLNQPSIVNDLMCYNFGFYNERNIRIFKDFMINKNDDDNDSSIAKAINEMRLFFDNFIFIYSPCRYKGKTCKDLIGNLRAEMTTSNDGNLTGGIFVDNHSISIYLNNGISIFLPIFEFIFTSQYGTPVILEEALGILSNAFDKKDYYSREETTVKDENFFLFLMSLMEKYDHVNAMSSSCNLFTMETMNKLIELGQILIKNEANTGYTLSKQFFKYIIFNPKIILHYEPMLQIELWKKVYQLYVDYKTAMYCIFDARSILTIIVKVYDNDVNTYCCESHYKMLCEKKEKCISELNPKISSLISIMRVIMTNQNFISISQMNQVASVLTFQISPCLQIQVLRLLQEVLKNGNNDYNLNNEYINAFVKNNGIEYLMYLISISTLDVKYECIKIINKIFMTYSLKGWDYSLNDEFIPYLCSEFFPLRTPLGDEGDDKEEADAVSEGVDKKETKVPLEVEQVPRIKNLSEEITQEKGENESVEELQKSKQEDTGSINSLSRLEDDYWRMISSTSLIKSLSLPILYNQEYSNAQNDSFVEKLYTFLLKWLVNKEEESEQIQLDDSDVILFEPALNLLMQLVMYAGMILKQKFLSDLYILTQFNKINCCIILKSKYFYKWFLDLLLTYQALKISKFEEIEEIKSKTEKQIESGFCETILQTGITFHTSLIINSLILEQEKDRGIRIKRSFFGSDGNSKKPDTVDHKKYFDELMTWMHKVRKIGPLEGKASTALVRVLLFSLIEKCQQEIKKININEKTPIWSCYLTLILTAYEFSIMSNFDKKIEENKTNLEMFERSEIISEVVQNLNYDYSSCNDSKQQTPIINLWEDRKLLLLIYSNFKDYWSDSFFSFDVRNASYSEDEVRAISNLLRQKIFEEKPNAYCSELNLLMYKEEKSSSNSLMRCLFNIIILFIRLSETKDEISMWIKELERYILFLIISSQNLCIDVSHPYIKVNEAFLLKAQEGVCDIFILTMNFLIDEVNSPRREETNNDIVNEFTSSIRTLFISFVFIIEKFLIKKQEDTTSSTMSNFFNVLVSIKNTLIMNSQPSYKYSALWKCYSEYYLTKNNKNIFDLNDINEFKSNNFLEIPRRLSSNEYTYAFQENQNVSKVLKDQFSLEWYLNLIKERIQNGENIEVNRDICFEEKNYVKKVYKKVTAKVKATLDRIKNKMIKDAFDRVFTKKEVEYSWRNFKKANFMWRGKWIYLDDYLALIKDKKVKFKITNHYSQNLLVPLMKPIYEVDYYLPNFSQFDKSGLFIKEQKNDQQSNSSMFQTIHEEISANESVGSNEEKQTDPSQIKLEELKVTQHTNKSVMFYKNEHFSEFSKDYVSLDKIVKYFNLLYTSKWNKTIISISDYYTKLVSSQNISSKAYYDICLLKLTGHIKGNLIFTQKALHFIVQYPPKKDQKCNGALFTPDYSKAKKIIRIIQLKSIKLILKRRYYYKKNALEIYTTENKSFYFIFSSQAERDEIIKLIVDTTRNTTICSNSNLDKVIKEWDQWEMSTCDLLSLINQYAGRSFKDLTQYPVFPWIISDYESKEYKKFNQNTTRNLQKPIGALGSETRVISFQQKFLENRDSDEYNEGKYYYSSHYSNPFYVVHYLYRIFPYAACAIELQGGGFDKPSRQFISVPNSFHNCMTETTDVRELIPEFFYLPEIFLNINNINFGEEANKNCLLPPWCKDSPYLFIIKNKLALESQFVSSTINNWIDLIFGYKQKGKEAENSMNVFFKFMYEDEIDIGKYEKEDQKDEYESLISKVDFGQVPSQLFSNKPFTKRSQRKQTKKAKIILETLDDGLLSFSSTSEHINNSTYKTCCKNISSKMIIHIKALKSGKILCVFNNGICKFLKADDTPYSESGLIFINEKKCILPSDYKDPRNYNNRVSIIEEDEDIMKTIENNQPVVTIRNGKYIIKGGYYDSKFLLYSTDYDRSYIFIQINEDCKVTSLLTDNSNEKYLYVGTSSGKIFVYEITTEKEITKILNKIRIINDHSSTINHMFISTKLNVFASVSNDKTCNVYSYPKLDICRVILSEEGYKFDFVFISSSPLPTIILYSKSEMVFLVYSLNGDCINKVKSNYRYLFSPKIIEDNYQRDHLIFGTQDGCLVIRRLPLFDNTSCLELKNQDENMFLPIKCFDFSEDGQNIYYWHLENFNISVLKCQKDKKAEDKNQNITFFDGTLNI